MSSHTQLSFDRYTQLVRDTLQVPAAIVSLVGEQAQVLVGASGLPEPWQEQRWTPLVHSICQLVTQDGSPLAVPDARLDERTSHNPATTELDVVAYLGVPLQEAGQVVGALCAIDGSPREWSQRELHILTGLAAACSAELTLRDSNHKANARRLEAESAREAAEQDGQDARIAQHRSERQTVAIRESERHSRLLLALSETLAATSSVKSVIQVVQETAATYLDTETAIFTVAEQEDLPEPPPGRTLLVPLSGTLPGRLILTWDTEAKARPWTVGEGLSENWHAQAQETVSALAHYASTALDRAILLQERRSAAATLQHAMLTTLPAQPDAELVARYVPAASANQVGGDWYDAFTVSGDLALIIGDVAGHDIEAAATMGQVRSILRGLLIDRAEPPAQMITRLDSALTELGMPTNGSLVLAVLHPGEGPGPRTLSWANAGHPAPLVVQADGRTRLLDEPSDLLLGIPFDLRRHTHQTELAPGDTLVLYTDGLIERPGRTLSHGQEALCRSASEHYQRPAQEMLDHILRDLITNAPDDDCAVLVIRLTP
ncbi:GAF domain-containing SpoIIE family protein phosphatase [Kineosporia babensis]|uniref:SpoIIE family protein phosphatase n=1 Tax=Kineosporia babensis TaxID=499548 RepID=A0A9X1NCF4_9ACTN|nr:GAF domain-containing SpoIIE family protein phosphatase [Kineosporia babensis]MCD5311209.1 SpoIIE family protein phosphatase [Kineosporia babensis]